jgi:hypothetical protein
MFDRYIRIFCILQLCLFLIFGLPNPHVANLNGQQININTYPTVSDKAWSKVQINPGKDKLNAHNLRNTRGNIMKSVFIIIGGVFLLFIIGGIISIIIYCVEKK